MGNIIDFHSNPLSNIKKQLQEKEKELDQVKKELAFFKRMYSKTSSTSDMLKLEVADLNAAIVILEGHLRMVQENLKKLQARLHEVDKQKAQVRVYDPDDPE